MRHMAHGQRTPKYGSDTASEHPLYFWIQCHRTGELHYTFIAILAVQPLFFEGCYDERFL